MVRMNMASAGTSSKAAKVVVVKSTEGTSPITEIEDYEKGYGTGSSKLADNEGATEEIYRLALWDKLRRGQLQSITRKDVVQFYEALNYEETDKLMEQDLSVLEKIPDLNFSSKDVSDIFQDCDADDDGKVSVDELYKALIHGSIAANVAIRALQNSYTGTKHECRREDLIEFLDHEHTTRDAFWSLPWTFAIFFVWILLLRFHLLTETAYSVQSALLAEVQGEGPPYLMKYVHDAPTFWDWMNTSFMSSHFKSNLQTFPFPGRVASFNQIVGGIQLARTNSQDGLCQQSPDLGMAYDSQFGGQCYRTSETYLNSEYLLYHEREQDIKAQLGRLQAQEWLNQNTTVLNMLVLFYNAHNNVFTSYDLSFGMQDASGYVKILWSMETFSADPYYNWAYFIPDALFMCFLLKMLYVELKEMVPAMLVGMDGFFQYCEFFNIVDWLAIILGIFVMSLWGVLVSQIGQMADIIGKLPTKALDDAVLANSTFLTSAQFESISPRGAYVSTISELHTKMLEVAGQHESLRLWAYWYSFVLMVKFFKAFQANPQLNIVILTMTEAASDIAHFTIVFATIFWVFSTSGCIIFGRNIKGFRNSVESAFTCWAFLMGDYDTAPLPLAAGWLAWVWMISFQFLVTVILLNMLLAIIMEQYLAIKGRNDGGPNIAKQMKDMLATVGTERGFVNMWTLICALKDEEHPTHPGKGVTTGSLKRAFQYLHMTRKNADYLIDQTIKHHSNNNGETSFSLTDTMKHIGHMKSMVMKIADTTEKAYDMLQAEANKPKQARFDAILAGQDPDEKKPFFQSRPQSRPNSSQMPRPNSSQMPRIMNSPTPTSMSMRTTEDSWRPASPPSIDHYDSNPRMDLLLAKIDQLQSTLEATQLQVKEHKEDHEKRYLWLEQQVASLDNKCHKIQRASDNMRSSLQSVDFNELMSVPGAVQQLNLKQSTPTSNRSNTLLDNTTSNKLERQVQDLTDKVVQLLSHANEQSEMRNMMWRIDLSVKRLQDAFTPAHSDSSSNTSARHSVHSSSRHEAPSIRQSSGNTASHPVSNTKPAAHVDTSSSNYLRNPDAQRKGLMTMT